MELTHAEGASAEVSEVSALQQLVEVSAELSQLVADLLLRENELHETKSSDEKALHLCEWSLTTLKLRESNQLVPVAVDLAIAEHLQAEQEGESCQLDPDESLAEFRDTNTPAAPLAKRDQLSLGFEGDITTVPLPLVLQMVRSKGQDGILIVHTETETASVVFEDGYVVHASSDRGPPGSRLGDVLVNQLVIDAETLTAFLDDHRDHHGYLGRALLDEGLVSSEALTNALTTQVQGVLNRVFAAKRARFGFFEGLPPNLDSRIRMDVSELLLEGACEQKEM